MINLRATSAFVAAHIVSVIIHNAFVYFDLFALPKSGFIMHTMQASLYVFISLMAIDLKLRLAALAITFFYIIIAINWAFLERGIEVQLQSYFYEYFASIIMTINIIVIYLLGRDSGIHLFNRLSDRFHFVNKVRLFFGSVYNSSVHYINLHVSNTHIKSEKKYK